jgi:hypothetical protein
VPARAHVVYGTTTVRLLTLQSDLVARVRITDPAAAVAIDEPRVRETVVLAEVLEPLKGSHAEKRLRFVPHGHGEPKYEKGEEVALFVQRIERSRELGGSPIAERVHWVSVQESGAKFALDDSTRGGFAAAVRAYAALETLPPETQLDGLRRITVEALVSPDPRLASSAVRDIVLAADLPIVTAEDLPLLDPILAGPETPIGVRVALLTEFERRGLVDAPSRWAELLRTTSGSNRIAVARAAGAHPSKPVTKELVALLGSGDPQLVSVAAISLGAPGDEPAVAPLSRLLASDSPRVRMAAIRALGRVATPGARDALAQAAASHPDEATRRRAAAEVKLIEVNPHTDVRAASRRERAEGATTLEE